MNLFSIRTFVLEASPAQSRFLTGGDAFGPGYGNRLASERRFRDAWQSLRRASPEQASSSEASRGACA